MIAERNSVQLTLPFPFKSSIFIISSMSEVASGISSGTTTSSSWYNYRSVLSSSISNKSRAAAFAASAEIYANSSMLTYGLYEALYMLDAFAIDAKNVRDLNICV